VVAALATSFGGHLWRIGHKTKPVNNYSIDENMSQKQDTAMIKHAPQRRGIGKKPKIYLICTGLVAIVLLFLLSSAYLIYNSQPHPITLAKTVAPSLSSQSFQMSKSPTSSSPIASSSAPQILNYPITTSLKLPVLMYHHVADLQGVNLNDAVAVSLRVSPTAFEAHLKYIEDQGYTTITDKDLADYFAHLKPLPAKPLMLTFDDGYQDNYNNAFPLLKKHGMKGVFALINGVVGSGEYLSIENAREMFK
jgi:hypothetical protein